MKNKKIILVLTILFSSKLLAINFDKENFSLALGAQGSSLLYKRGIVTYSGYQIIPIYSLNLFNENLLLAGSGLYYKLQASEKSHFWFRLNGNSTPDRPLYSTVDNQDERVERKETSEFDIFYQYEFERSSYLRFNYSKDLKAHKGNYYEFKFRYNIVDISNKGLFEIGTFVSLGYGDQRHNEYFYGNGASKSSLNNAEYGISVTSSKAIDNFWPTLKLTRFEILGDENQNASFVREKSSFTVEALVAFKVW